MKAAQLVSYGGQDSLTVSGDVEQPKPGEGEVLVEVHAAGVNPFDIAVREGHVRQMAELQFPATLGGDFAGVLVETGQAVYGQAGALSGQGSFAEFTVVKASQLAVKPSSIDFNLAAGLPLAAGSAHQALVEHMNLQPGQKILIHGGAGGIGSLAIQLAKHLGAVVATTASADQADFVRSLGADTVIDYKTQDFSQQLVDYDAVFDTVGGETNQKSYAVLKTGGSLVSMVQQPDENLVQAKNLNYITQFTQVTTERLEAIAKLVDDGTLKVTIDKIYPLDQAAEALEYLKTGSPKGKVVLQIK